ncbi:uncharacterized protein SCHCODRAFT_02639760, partial [Schizophyllum commune H4-8]|uniref:uncharacterized protein n=1 Tax=Schizophyllum commune (strain H4-8 / FGSC 9210) TaxID=578458 RepID=UPI0021605699
MTFTESLRTDFAAASFPTFALNSHPPSQSPSPPLPPPTHGAALQRRKREDM